MESLNALEKLSLLETKIVLLIERVKAEQEINLKLKKENDDLLLRLQALESTMLKGSQNIDELNQERMLTKLVVDELINSIDKLGEIQDIKLKES